MKEKKQHPSIEIGNRYGKLVVDKIGKMKNGRQYWICKCDCGSIKEIVSSSLKSDNGTRSCGCLAKERIDVYNSQKHTKTFYDWCIENNLQSLLNRWDNGLNVKSPNQIGFKSNKAFWFKCLDNSSHTSELFRLDNGVGYYIKYGSVFNCKQCSFYSFAQWGIDTYGNDFLDKFWDYEKNVVSPWNITYTLNDYIFIKCPDVSYHESNRIKANNFTNGNRCPYCNGNSGKIHALDSLGSLYPDVIKIWSDNNLVSPYEYAPHSNKSAYFKCENGIHDDYSRKITDSYKSDFRCPNCVRERDESFLQEKVRIYMSNILGYKLNHEHNCTIHPHNPKTGKAMPFDNELIELNLIIEVHGERHYRADGFTHQLAKKRSTTPEYELQQQKWRDEYKKQYALAQGYYYLEIPYWTEKDESYKTLIDKEIKSILHIKEIIAS